ncbi:MAG TPA: GTP-binding protein, partial [Candidatus Hydrogenedentes bacterium]|nr:GTP-binding protein [Candidatus Hydrogenedentota bacterium]
MIPLALVTGFLGSGKTTLLRRLVDRYRDRRVAYLVNEFSHVDVDGRRLAETAENVQILPGGSIFCSCLVHEFIGTLDAFPKRMAGPLDGVVIEASGVASPAVISKLLHDTRLDQVYALNAVVSIVDPGSFPVLLQSLPNIATQVAASTLILVNKRDLYDAATVAAAEAQARAINNNAPIVRTCHCEIDADILAPALACPACAGSLAPCRDPNYAQFDLALARPVDLPRFEQAVRDA